MTAAVSLIVLLVILGSSIAVAAGMGLTGVVLNQFYSSMPLTRILGELTWSTTSNFILTAIPFYIMFGEILLRSGIAERMYSSLMQWLSWLPGGLMHSNVGACALFGSVSGSSVATAATIGVVAMGEIDKHKYQVQRAALSRDACGGRNARHPDPAIHQYDHLRGHDRHVGAEALSRGVPSGLHPDDPVQPDRSDRMPVEAALGRQQVRDQLGRADSDLARSVATAGSAGHRHWCHFLRHCDGDGSGCCRHCRRARDYGLAQAAELRHAA